MTRHSVLILGSTGQVGRALQEVFSDATFLDRAQFDLADLKAYQQCDWSQYDTVINAAAYTAVDTAETSEGRRAAWAINATAVGQLAAVASKHRLTLVHISSDYVFDGIQQWHTEEEIFSPLSIYGHTKAAGDIAAATTPRHYIIRASWVVGNGKNFVRTMQNLCSRSVKPTVVNDQFGRLTFASDLAASIKNLVATKAPYGTYNVSNDGDVTSWADIAQAVYSLCGGNPADVTPVSTAEYYDGKDSVAPRPSYSSLNLDKIKASGFVPRDWRVALETYITTESEHL